MVLLVVHLEDGQRVYFTDAIMAQGAFTPPAKTLDCFLHFMAGRRFCQDTDVFRSALLLHVECNQKKLLYDADEGSQSTVNLTFSEKIQLVDFIQCI